MVNGAKTQKNKIFLNSDSMFQTKLGNVRVKLLVAQPSPILWDPMDCSPPGSSVHGISQARKQEWIATPFSRGSSWSEEPTQVFCIAGRFFTVWATRLIIWGSKRNILGIYNLLMKTKVTYTDTRVQSRPYHSFTILFLNTYALSPCCMPGTLLRTGVTLWIYVLV